MFFIDTLRRYLRDRGRKIFSFHDGARRRYADPVAVVVGLRRKGSLRAGAPLTACAVMLDNAASLEERAR